MYWYKFMVRAELEPGIFSTTQARRQRSNQLSYEHAQMQYNVCVVDFQFSKELINTMFVY